MAWGATIKKFMPPSPPMPPKGWPKPPMPQQAPKPMSAPKSYTPPVMKTMTGMPYVAAGGTMGQKKSLRDTESRFKGVPKAGQGGMKRHPGFYNSKE